MKKLIYIFSLIFIATFISCESDKLDIIEYGTISGTVLDAETYNPLPGVLITTSPASVSILTDAQGKFTINKLVEGEVAVTIKKSEYVSNSLTVAIYKNENTSMDFLMFKDNTNLGNINLYDPVPGNGAVDQNLTLTFEWKVEGYRSSIDLTYNVYIFESNSTVQQLLGESLDGLTVTTNSLKNSTTYYWYVVAKYEGTKVAFSPTWSFRTLDK